MDIVMFGFNDWYQWESQSFRTRCGALARAMSSHADVGRLLVISTPRSWIVNAARNGRERFGGPADSRTVRRAYAPRQVAEKVYTLDHTRVLPREGSRDVLLDANGRLHDAHLRKAIAEACSALGMTDHVLWVANPLMAKHIGCTGEAVSVFDAIDDWAAHPQKKGVRRSVERGYARVNEAADVIFTVSTALGQRFQHAKGELHHQPNGVDAARFEGELMVPSDMAGLRRPIVGYVGVLQERVDVGLLESVAALRPEYAFVLVGPELTPEHFEPLRRVHNVHLLGARRPEEIPAYVASFDVCMVPHVDDALTRSMDPLKVYEYLAAGKPVAATGVPDLGEPEGVVVRARGAESFVALLDAACARGDDHRAAQALRFARERSWTNISEKMLATVRAAGDLRGRCIA